MVCSAEPSEKLSSETVWKEGQALSKNTWHSIACTICQSNSCWGQSGVTSEPISWRCISVWGRGAAVPLWKAHIWAATSVVYTPISNLRDTRAEREGRTLGCHRRNQHIGPLFVFVYILSTQTPVWRVKEDLDLKHLNFFDTTTYNQCVFLQTIVNIQKFVYIRSIIYQHMDMLIRKSLLGTVPFEVLCYS